MSSNATEKREEIPPPPIPKGCRPLSHQVAGHIYGKCKTRAGLLQDNFGSILKLLQTNNRGTREKKFYQMVFGEEQCDPLLLSVRDLVSPFKGTVISEEDPSVEYIKLGDMTAGFTHPCIMDVKIGRIGYEDGTNSKKVQMAKLKYPHMDQLGFQILGMRIYHPRTKKYSHYDKVYGRSLDVTSMIEGLAKFFNVEEDIRTDIMYSFLVRLQQILDWFEVQTNYHFYSSSLLFIYEAAITQEALTSPCTLLPHSSKPSNGIDRTHGCDASRESEKPATYPLKRKKLTNDADDDAQGTGTVSEKDNGAISVGEGDSGSTAMVDAENNSLSSDKDLKHSREGGHRWNGVRWKATSNTPGSDPRPSQQQVPLSGSVDIEPTGCQAPTNGPVHHRLPSVIHSTNRLSAQINPDGCHKSWMLRAPGDPTKTRPGSAATPVEIRMIDFAHAIESTTRDENYIFGLKMLMQYIETLHNCFLV